MNFEFFIAKRIFSGNKAGFSGPIIRIAVISVGLGIAVMLIAISIVTGFQKEVREKVIGFGSHIQISNFDVNTSLESKPVNRNSGTYERVKQIPGIRHIQVFANKAGILKTEEYLEGIILKGIDRDFDWTYFGNKIRDGKIFSLQDSMTCDSIVISQILASRLRLKTGDAVRMYFVSENELQPRGRKFMVSGIYETGLEEFDKLYIFCDIRHVQKLNNWPPEQVSGFEVLLNDYKELNKMAGLVYENTDPGLNVKTIEELEPHIFEWLKLHDMNVLIIIVLMIIVSAIAMISTLLIMILEKSNYIGILKSLGAKNSSIQRIFIYNAFIIIARGLLWGNACGLGLLFLQWKTGLFKLNQESYYVPVIPVNFDPVNFLLINVGTLILCTTLMLLPAIIIGRIMPVRAVRFT